MEPNDANETERPLEHDRPSRPAGNPETDGPKKVSPGARALARWLGLGFIVIVGGIAGFYVPRLLWLTPASRYGSEPSAAGKPPAAEKAAAVEADSPRGGDRQVALRPWPSQAAAATDGLPDPDSPLPATPSALLSEAARVANQLVRSFPDDADSLEVRARFEDWRGRSEEAANCWERCLDLNPKYGHAYYGLSTLAAEKAEYEKAADLLRKALALEPDWPQAQIELAKALLNLDRPDEAIAVLKKHVGTSPLPAEGYYWLGQAQAQKGAYDEARQSYERAVKLLPRYTDAYHGLATVYTRLEEKEKARQCAEKFRELKAQDFKVRKTDKVQFDDLGAMAEDLARVYINAGRIYHARGRLRETEKLWRRAAALAPKELEYRQSLAWLYRTSGRLADAIRMLEQLGEMDPKNLSYPLEIGRLHARLKQFEAAERSFRAVSQRWPEHFAGYAALAELYLQTNRHLPEAVPLAQKAVQLNPAATSYMLLGAVREKNGDIVGAVTAVEQAMKLDPDNAGYRRACALLRAKLGPEDLAAGALPDPASPLPVSQAALLEEMDRVTEGVVAASPDDPESLAVKAHYQAWLGNSAEAAKCWQRCLELNPGYGRAYYGLGTLAERKGEDEEAAGLFRKALSVDARLFSARVELARALLNLGRADEAAAALEGHIEAHRLASEAYRLLGEAYLQLNRYREAKRNYEAAIAADPRRARAYYGLATTLTRMGESQTAQTYMEKFRELWAVERKDRRRMKVNYDDLEAMQEDAADLYMKAGQFYYGLGKLREAEKLWQRAAAFDRFHLECRRGLASLYGELGRLSEAIRMLEQLAEMDPKNPTYLLEAGWLYAQLKQFEAAERSFRAVSQRWPEHYAGYAALAQFYVQTDHRLPEAVTLAQKAVRLKETARGYALLSTACRKNGDTDGAAAAMKRAVALDPDNVTYRQAYDLLQKEP